MSFSLIFNIFFSCRRLPAFTLSHLAGSRDPMRQTLLDTPDSVSSKALQRNTRMVAEALACSLYPRLEKNGCEGDLFGGSLEPRQRSLEGWLKLITSYPRHPSLLSDKNSGNFYIYEFLIDIDN